MMKDFISFSFSFQFLELLAKLCEIDSILECNEHISQATELLRSENWASILEMLDQSDYFELLVKFFGCICEAVPNNDVLMFLSMLRSSLVCDTFIPL